MMLRWLGEGSNRDERDLDAAWPRRDHDEPEFREAARKVRSGWYLRAENVIAVGLTPRQHEIMQLKLDGLPDRAIAAQLCISQRTVDQQVCAAYERMRDAGLTLSPYPHLILQQLTSAIAHGRVRLESRYRGLLSPAQDS